MTWLSFHLASGASLFSGAGLLIIATLLTAKSNGRSKFLCKLAACLGAALMALSSSPFPSWSYSVFLIAFLGWISLESITRVRSFYGLLIARGLLIGLSLVAVVLEFPHRRFAQVPSIKHESIYIVGDSISAGIDQNPTWSDMFRKRYGVNMTNLARPAATLRSSLAQADLISEEECLVLLEIGGNDLLGKANPTDFRNDLKTLLISLNKPARTIVMLELPLLPGQAGLGRAQRSLAEEYGAYLIPKRYFCQVLSSPNATIDGLHLSPIGASLMAETIHMAIGSLLLRSER